VALGGTSKPSPATFKRLRELGAETVLLALDDDQSGRLATAAAVRCAWEAGVEPAVVQMPTGCKDPDEVFRRLGPATGLETLRSSVRNSAEWLVGHWADTPDGAAHIIADARRTAACAPPIALATIITGVAHVLGIETELVRADLLRAAEEERRRVALLQFQQWAREVQTLGPQDVPDAVARGHAMLEALQGGRAT
jgi:DNA primase